MKVAVVGATGLVGGVMSKVLEERAFPLDQLLPVASDRSIGSHVRFRGQDVPVIGMQDAIAARPDLALFSAGGAISLEWAPRFAEGGCIVVDNSSAWRMDPTKKLVVPEINGQVLGSEDRIIANPNCSTIQMLMVLAPLHRAFGALRVIVSTYQAVTGTGMKAVRQLESEQAAMAVDPVYPHRIAGNLIPQCDSFTESGYTKEELKLVNETHKILDPAIAMTATAVRVPVTGGHSESINVEFAKPFELDEVRSLIQGAPGVVLCDDPAASAYPMPIDAAGKDDVFVGRIRRDVTRPNALNLWVVADNLRKGAATNAVQIAELLVSMGLLRSRVDAGS
ncbi:MAG: aspartate-semialdehyde dehydrogenase [Flavobacteriales bacterium]|nr:aspartate-semialdehyde dehydrogenase [Flavobacteriales bacterium]